MHVVEEAFELSLLPMPVAVAVQATMGEKTMTREGRKRY